MNRLLCALSGLAIVTCSSRSVRAQTVPVPTCGSAIAASERIEGLPPQVLGAIGIVESGRVNPHTGIAAPWPWTINVAGTGHVFDSSADAIAAVQAAQAAGVQSIDVGCMQINLLQHPHAFATLQDAFDPTTNVRYAAAFLARLREQTGSWSAAIAAYHSATPALGLPYARTVALVWPLATRFGLAVPDPAASTRAALEAAIDPHDVMTREFRTRLVDAALQRRRELMAQGDVTTAAATNPALARLPGSLPWAGGSSRGPGALGAPDRSALEDEVDPQRVLTPAFRAQMVAAAIARHRRRTRAGGEGAQDTPSSSGMLSPHSDLLPAPGTANWREEGD